MTKLTSPSGLEITYTYRADGRVTAISVNGIEITRNIEYFAFGEPSSWNYGNNFDYQRTFDSDGRVETYTQGNDIQTLAYDPASRITALTDTSNSWGFTYDNLDRLETADKAGTSLIWDYDPTGNRLFEKLNTVQTDYITELASNKLAQLGTTTRTYDAVGNLEDSGALTSTYSGRNRLISTQGTIAPTIYEYNAFGERVSKQSTAQTLFSYDEDGHLVGEYQANGDLIQETIWLDDTPIATIRPNTEIHNGLVAGNVKVFFIQPDHLDSPRTIVDNSNQAIWQWHSDPFGKALANQDVDGDSADFIYNLRFPGQYFDVETETHYNYFRDYEAETGRYLQSDPIGLDWLENRPRWIAFPSLISSTDAITSIFIERNNKQLNSNLFINRMVGLGFYFQGNGLSAGFSTYLSVGSDPIDYIDSNGLAKTKTWTDGRGRKQVVIYCKSFKDAKNKANANGGIFRKKRKNGRSKKGVRGECQRCGGRHLHDAHHNNPNKPNIHYEY